MLFASSCYILHKAGLFHDLYNYERNDQKVSSDEVDLIPTRDLTSLSSSRGSSTDSSSLHANIIRLDPGKDIIIHGNQTPVSQGEKVEKGLVLGEATSLASKAWINLLSGHEGNLIPL